VKKINFSALPSNPSDFFIEVVPIPKHFKAKSPKPLWAIWLLLRAWTMPACIWFFYRNGSLPDFILPSDAYNKPLSWSSHVKIARVWEGIRSVSDEHSSSKLLCWNRMCCISDVFTKLACHLSSTRTSSQLTYYLVMNLTLMCQSDCGFADLIPNHELQVIRQFCWKKINLVGWFFCSPQKFICTENFRNQMEFGIFML
jgi:hypothetical protein